MKQLLKIIVVFIFLLSFNHFNAVTTGATSKKTAFVDVSKGSTLSVRSDRNSKTKKIGFLKDGVRVSVYSKTKNGWSEIRYKNKKGYVLTKYLMFANSYLKDTSKIYSYETKGEKYKEVYIGKSFYGEDKWKSDNEIYSVHEDKNGLYIGIPDFYYLESIKYPVKLGKQWRSGEQDQVLVRITAVNKTVKVPAGTFKNCIELSHNGIDKYYYAKNVGLIKSIIDGKITRQLISLKSNR